MLEQSLIKKNIVQVCIKYYVYNTVARIIYNMKLTQKFRPLLKRPSWMTLCT